MTILRKTEIDLAVERILGKALDGAEIEPDEALKLFHTQGHELEALRRTADEIRQQISGDEISFVIVRNINFTNICYAGCRFCAFAKPRDDPEAQFMSLEEVAERADQAWQRSATEVCIQGGLHPNIDGFYYRDLLTAIKNRVPEMHIHAFSPFEIQYGSRRAGMTIRDFLRMLMDHGLGSMPGTAAEILDPEIRKRLTKDKLSADQWVNIVTTAHRLGLRTTSTIMYGHIDSPLHWVKHLTVIRDLQKQTGGFTEFVPLGFIHPNAPIYLDGEARPGPTTDETLQMHAVARLMLRGWIDNIQVSWVKLGPSVAQQVLNSGANDFGGTLMNESISRAAGAMHGQELPPDRMCKLIREIGRIPVQRNTLYKVINRFDDHNPTDDRNP